MNKYLLNNGLRVMIENIPTSRSVSFGIWVKSGSRYEQVENNGISHFIEHMLFKGTHRYCAKDIADRFDGMGGNVNAFTSKEYTCYYIKVLARHLPQALDILADMFFNSQLTEGELKKEKNVILEEIAMNEDTPDDFVHDLSALAAYADHPLAYSILGTKQRLFPLTSLDLKRYLNDNYSVNQTVLSLAGQVDDSVLPLLEKHFGHFTNFNSQKPLTAPVFKSQALLLNKKTEQNHICLTFPGVANCDARFYAMILLNNVLGGGMSSRLFQEIREKRGLAYSVYSYHSSFMDAGLWTIYAGMSAKHTSEVYAIVMEVLNELATKGLTNTELIRAKEQLKGNLILNLESNTSRMNRMGKNELILERHETLDEVITRIDRVDHHQIQKLVDDVQDRLCAVALVGVNSDCSIRRDFIDYDPIKQTSR